MSVCGFRRRGGEVYAHLECIMSLGTNPRQRTTPVVPCANSRGPVVAIILRYARHLNLQMYQLNTLMSSTGQ